MVYRGTRPYTFRATGLWDALDGEGAPPGACFQLQNLIHDITTQGLWIGRPAVTQLTNFSSFSSPSVISVMYAVGTKIFGMIGTLRNVGCDEPFVFDTVTGTFTTVLNVQAANCPTTQASVGAWTPPTMDTVGGRIIVTHPGFSGSNFVGWFDISGFSSATITGTTHSNTTVDTLSSNVLTAGWQVGMQITGTNIPAGTFITAINSAGTSITISQAATGSSGSITFTVTGGSLASPLWGAGNTTVNALPSVPTFVKQFNNRAYYACNNQLWFSDSLSALTITNATQFLTCGDSGTAITGIGALAVQQTQGGILAAIMAFKATQGYWQVTGDASISAGNQGALALNGPIGGVGCSSPRGILQLPDGLGFVAEDGVRTIDFMGNISKAPMQGVRSPFQQAIVPSRICAAYNNTVLRISLQTVPNVLTGGITFVDYWYDYEIENWCGPHTFAYDCAVPLGDGFALVSNRQPGVIYYSDTDQHQSSTYTELGSAMTFMYQSALFPEDEEMAMKEVVESQIDIAFGGARMPLTAQIVSSTQGVAAQASVSPILPTIWGQFLWGGAKWSGAQVGLRTYNLDWDRPAVYKNAGFLLQGQLGTNFHIGPARFRTKVLPYMNDQNPA